MENDLVSPGDTIEVGVTHEVLIGREKSWVKYGVVTKVREGETGEQASERAAIQMNEEVEKKFESQEKTIEMLCQRMDIAHERIDAIREMVENLKNENK